MNLEQIHNKIILVHDCEVILDRDVASLYNIETKRINEAVRNNPDKFPEGYIIQLTAEEWESLRSNFSTLKTIGRGKHSKFLPKAFSEKGLYMLATIIKSPIATQTTIAIVETFAKLRQLAQLINETSELEDSKLQKNLLKKGNALVKDIFNEDFHPVSTETTIELNLSVLKLKHSVKKELKKKSLTDSSKPKNSE